MKNEKLEQGVSVHFLSSFDCVRLYYLLDSPRIEKKVPAKLRFFVSEKMK